MMNEASGKQIIRQWEMRFPGGQRARAVACSTDTPAPLLQSALGIPQPGALLAIVGGAFQMDAQLYPHVRRLLIESIAPAVALANGLIIDGGTFAGVMQLIGEARIAQSRMFPLLGISPAGCVAYPEMPPDPQNTERVPLDPNHSHFVLVDANEWGGETRTMYELVQLFSAHCPSLALVVNGGAIALQEVLYNVRQKRPVIVIEGSGRVADEVAHCWRERPASIANPALAEIIAHGALSLFPLTGSPAALTRLVQSLLR